MQDIPSEVFREILWRVPAEHLLRFRCVSKGWKDTIDDPNFVNLHTHRQIHHSNAVAHLILRGDFGSCLYSLSLDSLKRDDCEIVQVSPLSHEPSYGLNKSTVGSCNGIVMVSDLRGYSFLWNPLTRESHRLPPIELMTKKMKGLYIKVCGIGFVCATNDYKVVNIAQVFDPRDRILVSETVIYCLKLDSWRRIKDFPYRITRSSGGIFVRGALHWVSSTVPLKCLNDLIVGLDLETEEYHVLPLPSELSGLEKPSAKSLGLLGGCLVLSCYYQIERLDVWLMEEYGIKNSWIKLFSIVGRGWISAVETLRPLAYSRCNRQVLLQHNKKEFLWYDLETKMVNKMRICGGPATFSSLFCLESLVRLNHGKAKAKQKDHQGTVNKVY